jgi:REP element-mobilizing transposase RayT
MHVISKDSPCYFLTSVAKDRLPVFRTDEIKEIAGKALDESRRSGKFALYAYVIMPDHLHVITDSARASEDTLRFINGIISHRVITYLKEKGYESSLLKLRQETKRRHYQHSLWDHHPNVRVLFTEKMLMERVHYIHENAVRAGLIERAKDYRYSSVRCWNRTSLDDEKLLMDIGNIKWRSGRRSLQIVLETQW